jgi:hypothetical protein
MQLSALRTAGYIQPFARCSNVQGLRVPLPLDPYPVLLSDTLLSKRPTHGPRTGIRILYSPICLKWRVHSLTQNRGALASDFFRKYDKKSRGVFLNEDAPARFLANC